jgi:hypothetical protein
VRNLIVIKLWKVLVAKNGLLPVFAFFWVAGPISGQGRFVANSKRTFIRLATDKKIKLMKHTRWSIQVQLLAHLKEVHPAEFSYWLGRFYPQIADELFSGHALLTQL